MEQFELPRLYQPITGAKIVYAPTQGEDHFKFRPGKTNGKKTHFLSSFPPCCIHSVFDPHPRSVPLAAVFNLSIRCQALASGRLHPRPRCPLRLGRGHLAVVLLHPGLRRLKEA